MTTDTLPQGQPQVGTTDLFASFEDVCEQICRRLPEGGGMLTEQLRTALDKANAEVSQP